MGGGAWPFLVGGAICLGLSQKIQEEVELSGSQKLVELETEAYLRLKTICDEFQSTKVEMEYDIVLLNECEITAVVTPVTRTPEKRRRIKTSVNLTSFNCDAITMVPNPRCS
ncbi:unnamed protein product [Microthlaspi erraticum]|uniref:Uncharacterized protein n=1 Tax=Microthlaspi erraticum TaxID=1685480 RepID=A0A6D2JPR4_9BRAS|nr:unnamed protein product [Microthlaspi erraticum]